MHILSPETDNCPVENISWSISTKECCRPRRGLNPRPPGLQSDGASNWATEAGSSVWIFPLAILEDFRLADMENSPQVSIPAYLSRLQLSRMQLCHLPLSAPFWCAWSWTSSFYLASVWWNGEASAFLYLQSVLKKYNFYISYLFGAGWIHKVFTNL